MNVNIRLLDKFRLKKEKENFPQILEKIEKDTVFRGTNLWVLIFSIMICSLGLNINATAVVIGAMLISPLLGPIFGLGVGVAIRNLHLIRKAANNYVLSAVVGLVASSFYFLVTPLDEAHSEILARTQPTIYDVLIAGFGGLAGSLAMSSKQKGNVIPGVAIATALMPPLCTAGYGLATWQLQYFLGAFYLYIINSVFIASATILTTWLLKFPVKQWEDPATERREKGIILTVIMITLVPSIYLGYDIVRQHNFRERAKEFITSETSFQNIYLLKDEIDTKRRSITLTFGGKQISDSEIVNLNHKLRYYNIEDGTLKVKQGFAFLSEKKQVDKANQLALALKESESDRFRLLQQMDSVNLHGNSGTQLFNELRVHYPNISSAVIQPVYLNNDTLKSAVISFLVLLEVEGKFRSVDEKKLEEWLKVRMNGKDFKLVINQVNAEN
ncbi:MAG: DUF389 domain-containing protein [Bacteroidetes bacterium]|nr:MAG: DUF389 domain-containing protein [Bacteroidota bacterium]REJ99982.1 MAG: DUF389 domain-containing protein [Bacteroidota bacterium]REK35838.1 MAG: DUF389 domain-containing protein [Bacteroidota bacterium]REK49291.1 MAG: DUF389 domain-containing protein [Bacteroidota bacterium]